MNLTVKVADWTIPYCGNVHCMPYGTLIVSDGKHKERCKTKGDKWDDFGPQYITFNKRRYNVINKGTSNYPKLELELVRKPVRKLPCQRNGYTIHFDKSRCVYNTRKYGKILEEFRYLNDAEDWCYEN